MAGEAAATRAFLAAGFPTLNMRSLAQRRHHAMPPCKTGRPARLNCSLTVAKRLDTGGHGEPIASDFRYTVDTVDSPKMNS